MKGALSSLSLSARERPLRPLNHARATHAAAYELRFVWYAEQVRASQRDITRSTRDLEREVQSLRREEKTLVSMAQ